MSWSPAKSSFDQAPAPVEIPILIMAEPAWMEFSLYVGQHVNLRNHA